MSHFENPIDKNEAACLDQNPTIGGLSQCFVDSYNQWDKSLNTEYKNLKQNIDPDQQKQLKEAELAWISFRNLESRSLSHQYTDSPQQMVSLASSDKEIVRDRTLQISALNDVIKTGGNFSLDQGDEPEVDRNHRQVVQAYADADKHLNESYKDLLETLDPAGKAAAVQSEKAWLQFRDEEFILMNSMKDLMPNQRIQAKADLVEQRAMNLQTQASMNKVPNPWDPFLAEPTGK